MIQNVAGLISRHSAFFLVTLKFLTKSDCHRVFFAFDFATVETNMSMSDLADVTRKRSGCSRSAMSSSVAAIWFDEAFGLKAPLRCVASSTVSACDTLA